MKTMDANVVTCEMFAKEVSGLTGYAVKSVREVMNAMGDVIASHIENGDAVKITNIGTFSVGEIAERDGVDPQTGLPKHFESSKKVKFAVARSLKELVKP